MNLPKLEIITCVGLTRSVHAYIMKPRNMIELQECVILAKKNNLQISNKGGGNSYTDVFMNSNQMLIDTSNLKAIKNFDSEKGIITVESGARIGDLLENILPKNWNLGGLSGSMNDTVGGMISGNTHGKDTWTEGNFGQNVLSLKILISNETTINVDKDSELFNALIGGLGFFGIITEVTLKLKQIPSFMVQKKSFKVKNLDAWFEKFYSLDEKETNFAYGVLDPFIQKQSIGRGIMEVAKYVDAPKCSTKELKKFTTTRSRIGPFSPEMFWAIFKRIWGYKTSYLFNKLYYYSPKSKTVIPFTKFQYVFHNKPKFNLLYAPLGFLEFQTLFPKKKSVEGFSKLISLSQSYHRQPWICGVKRHKSDSSYLSFSGEGLSITINFPLNNFKKLDKEKYSEEILDTILEFDGKIYLSKHSFLPKWAFQKMYPEYKKILQLKTKYDPNNLFHSDATKRLFTDSQVNN
jgi:decaprenylphospho-beta-D-ribofuranose 2-oxidase